jgi:Flp pilus assembly protein TadD
VCLDQLDRGEEALPPLARSIELEPAFAEARYSQGIVLLRLDRPEPAAVSFRGALAIHPEHPGSLAMLGVALLKNGDAQGALDPMEAAARIDPEREGAVENLTAVYTQTGAVERRLRFFSELAAAHPRSPKAVGGHAAALLALGRRAEAITPLLRAVGFSPQDSGLRLQLAGCFLDERRFIEAMTQVKEVLEREPDHAVARRLQERLRLEIEKEKGGG